MPTFHVNLNFSPVFVFVYGNHHGKYQITNVSHLQLMWMKSFSLECQTTSQYLVLDVSTRLPFRQYIFNS